MSRLDGRRDEIEAAGKEEDQKEEKNAKAVSGPEDDESMLRGAGAQQQGI